MPNDPPPHLSNITTTSHRSITHAPRDDASTINNSTSSPTNINRSPYRSSNRVDSPTYSSIVNNTTTMISPFTSNTTTGLSDATMPNPTNTNVLQIPPTTTSPPIDNNNNITAEDDNHHTTNLPPSKHSTVPTFHANYYQGLSLFDDDDYDDFDDDANDDERPLTQFDSALPSSHTYQHPTKRTINNNIISTAAHQHTNNKNTTHPKSFMTAPTHEHDIQHNPHSDTTSHCHNYNDNKDNMTITTQPNNKSILDKPATTIVILIIVIVILAITINNLIIIMLFHHSKNINLTSINMPSINSHQ